MINKRCYNHIRKNFASTHAISNSKYEIRFQRDTRHPHTVRNQRNIGNELMDIYYSCQAFGRCQKCDFPPVVRVGKGFAC